MRTRSLVRGQVVGRRRPARRPSRWPRCATRSRTHARLFGAGIACSQPLITASTASRPVTTPRMSIRSCVHRGPSRVHPAEPVGRVPHLRLEHHVQLARVLDPRDLASAVARRSSRGRTRAPRSAAGAGPRCRTPRDPRALLPRHDAPAHAVGRLSAALQPRTPGWGPTSEPDLDPLDAAPGRRPSGPAGRSPPRRPALIIVMVVAAIVGFAVDLPRPRPRSRSIPPRPTTPRANGRPSDAPAGRVRPEQRSRRGGAPVARRAATGRRHRHTRWRCITNGDSVVGTTTLDLCNGTYPSETLRTARFQVVEIDPTDGVERAEHRVRPLQEPAAGAQAFAEVRRVAAACPKTPVREPRRVRRRSRRRSSPRPTARGRTRPASSAPRTTSTRSTSRERSRSRSRCTCAAAGRSWASTSRVPTAPSPRSRGRRR